MIIASLETWHEAADEPMLEFEKEFFSREALDAWLARRNTHPFLFTILKGITEVD